MIEYKVLVHSYDDKGEYVKRTEEAGSFVDPDVAVNFAKDKMDSISKDPHDHRIVRICVEGIAEFNGETIYRGTLYDEIS